MFGNDHLPADNQHIDEDELTEEEKDQAEFEPNLNPEDNNLI
jgi:hypothetical protein